MLSFMSKSPRTLKVAAQLRELMDRHEFQNAPQLMRAMQKKGFTLSYVTINRILKAEAATEPDTNSLRKIAKTVGEEYEDAFPEQPQLVVEANGHRVALKSLDGKPLSAETLAELGVLLSSKRAEDVHSAKKRLRTGREVDRTDDGDPT